MPEGTQIRVRTPVSSLQEQVEHLHFHEVPACCAPLTFSEELSSSERPALNRNAASHRTTSSGKSFYSTDTDCSLPQSDDGNVDLSKYPDIIDLNVFEQVCVVVGLG